ncbi:hypothetical protein CsSME_00042739 [Camellia sinensis var. sinensis]
MTCSQLLVDAGCANGLSLGGFWSIHGHCQSYNAKFAVKLTCRRSAEVIRKGLEFCFSHPNLFNLFMSWLDLKLE